MGSKGMKWLKIIHVFLVVVFFGGILSSMVLNLHIDFTKYDESYLGYKNMMILSDYIVRLGAVGTLLIGFVYGFFTNWGFFKHRWVGVKFVLYIIQTIVGIFIVDELMVRNMEMLEEQREMAISNLTFVQNHKVIQSAVFFQITVTIFIFVISYLKPWRKKKVQAKQS